jgi:hypothetical protein
MKNWLFALILCALPVWAESLPCTGTQQNPCIVQDTQNNDPDLKNWRDTALMAKLFPGNIAGLAELWMSGSAVPSAAGWQVIAHDIKKATQNKVQRVIDVDLRQESHGYLNDNAITLTAANDWGNLGKSRKQVLIDEKNWLHFLDQSKIISHVLTPWQFSASAFDAGRPVMNQGLLSEKTAARNAGLAYFRLTVPDHLPPADTDVDRFVALVKALPPQTWLHIHCRGGDGRTTTFMAMNDMLHNASKVSLVDIVGRQAAAAPFYNLAQTDRKNKEYRVSYEKRWRFLQRFYDYSQASLKGYKGTWSEWDGQHT